MNQAAMPAQNSNGVEQQPAGGCQSKNCDSAGCQSNATVSNQSVPLPPAAPVEIELDGCVDDQDSLLPTSFGNSVGEDGGNQFVVGGHSGHSHGHSHGGGCCDGNLILAILNSETCFSESCWI